VQRVRFDLRLFERIHRILKIEFIAFDLLLATPLLH
jgi:hypothetical protein